jgi:mRNA interferase RelE/StbE
MARYGVELSGHARRQIRALEKRTQDRIIARLEALADNPRPAGAKKLAAHEPLWRTRIGDYRAVYKIEDDRLFLLVVNVGHRREVYR